MLVFSYQLLMVTRYEKYYLSQRRVKLLIFFPLFQFKDEEDETFIKEVNLTNPILSNDTNNYLIKPFEIFHSNNPARFGIEIRFEHHSEGIVSIIVNYHICGTLILVSSMNFLIDPKVVPGRAGLLVTVLLVLTNFFASAQVNNSTSHVFKSLTTLFQSTYFSKNVPH